jgi:phosphatidate cytidylyltransferase
MLKQRVLTALILIPVLVAALFYFPPGWIVVLFGLFIATAAWEWAALTGIGGIFSRTTYVFCILILGGAAIFSVMRQPSPIASFLAAAGLWWLWALAELISRKDVNKGMFATTAGKVVGGFLVLIPPWVASVYLLAVDSERPRLLLFLLVLVWVADTAAYFAGSFFGRTKLAPHEPARPWKRHGRVVAVVLLAWLWDNDLEIRARIACAMDRTRHCHGAVFSGGRPHREQAQTHCRSKRQRQHVSRARRRA